MTRRAAKSMSGTPTLPLSLALAALTLAPGLAPDDDQLLRARNGDHAVAFAHLRHGHHLRPDDHRSSGADPRNIEHVAREFATLERRRPTA